MVDSGHDETCQVWNLDNEQLRYNRGTMQKHHTLAGLFAGLAAASIWGGMYVVNKIVLEVIPPFALLTIRLVMGAMALGIVIYFRNKRAAINGAVITTTSGE